MSKEKQTTIPLRPLGDRVVVLPAEAEKKSAGGIILADSKNEKPQTGTVVAVGPGIRGDDNEIVPVSVSVGDTVVFSTYSPERIVVGGTEYLIIREESLLAVLN